MLFAALIGCYDQTNAVLLQGEDPPVDGEGWVDEVPRGDDPDDPEPADWSRYEGASFRIVSPASGELLPLDQPTSFEAVLLDVDGNPLAADVIVWSSSADATWDEIGTSFEDDRLPVGIHDITAVAELPNGDVYTYTAGGVRVQHPLGGTYAGFFSATGTAQGFSFTCSGTSTMRTGPLAEVAQGTGNCTASLIVFDLPLDWVFDLSVDPIAGTVSGTAGAAILGPFTYDFPATGTITEDRIAFTWNGTVPFISFEIDASLGGDRVSDDTL